jgi:LuxR family maltose regulon positive regulatory protein
MLSTRELDVLRLVADGASNTRIADELVVAVSTVKAHVNGVFRKLGATSRVEAIVRARDLGLSERVTHGPCSAAAN